MARTREELLKEIDVLLDELYRAWGFYRRLHARDVVPPGPVLTDVAFAHAVLRAEDMSPDSEPDWVRRIRSLFIARFGASVSLVD